MAKSNIDLSQLLKVYTKKYEKYFKDMIKKRIGIDGSSYSPLKNKRPKGHKQSLDSRLNDSGQFQKNVVVVKSDDKSLIIEGNTGRHSSGISYNDILVYNSRDSGNTNPNITNPPKVFPTTVEEFENLEVTKQFYTDLQKLIEIQLGVELKGIKFPTNIKIG